jgi:hypothetical protein
MGRMRVGEHLGKISTTTLIDYLTYGGTNFRRNIAIKIIYLMVILYNECFSKFYNNIIYSKIY